MTYLNAIEMRVHSDDADATISGPNAPQSNQSMHPQVTVVKALQHEAPTFATTNQATLAADRIREVVVADIAPADATSIATIHHKRLCRQIPAGAESIHGFPQRRQP